MKPLVSIIMGSTSDLPVMEKARKFLNDLRIPLEVNASPTRCAPAVVEELAKEAANRSTKVIIAAAGMAAMLPSMIVVNTTLPVISVPIKGMLDGLDTMFSIIQMPPDIPVAMVGVNASINAAILAVKMLVLTDESIAQKIKDHKAGLDTKITKVNADLAQIKDYGYKTN